MYHYELTNYPHIYKKCYWGQCEIKILYENWYNNIIIQNRNQFINEFHIIKMCCKEPEYVRNEHNMNKYYNIEHNGNVFDHIECYETNDGRYILISSPYHLANENVYIQLGWEKIYNLYSTQGATFMKIINKK